MQKSSDRFRLNLRRWIVARNLTQKDLAAKAGVSRPYLCRVLAGEIAPSLEKCERLSTAAGLPLIDCLVSTWTFAKKIT